MDYELEVARDNAQASPDAALVQEGNNLTTEILKENDPAKLEDLTNLFNINQKKKNIARLNRLSNLLELIDTEAIERITAYPDAIDNDQLISYMNATQNAIKISNNNISQDAPLIQINNTKNEIRVDTETSGLDRASRARVLEVVNSILNSAKNDEVIDVTPNQFIFGVYFYIIIYYGGVYEERCTTILYSSTETI